MQFIADRSRDYIRIYMTMRGKQFSVLLLACSIVASSLVGEPAMATQIEKGSYFAIDTVTPSRVLQGLLTMTLYVQQIVSGPKQNQQVVVSGATIGFGTIAVSDWTVFDGMGEGANLVGDMKGMHVMGSMTDLSWSIYFDLVFNNGRFKGSALKLLGSVGPGEGQWAIVGGTGEFTLAQGIVSYKTVQDDGSVMKTRELKFRVFYRP